MRRALRLFFAHFRRRYLMVCGWVVGIALVLTTAYCAGARSVAQPFSAPTSVVAVAPTQSDNSTRPSTVQASRAERTLPEPPPPFPLLPEPASFDPRSISEDEVAGFDKTACKSWTWDVRQKFEEHWVDYGDGTGRCFK